MSTIFFWAFVVFAIVTVWKGVVTVPQWRITGPDAGAKVRVVAADGNTLQVQLAE